MASHLCTVCGLNGLSHDPLFPVHEIDSETGTSDLIWLHLRCIGIRCTVYAQRVYRRLPLSEQPIDPMPQAAQTLARLSERRAESEVEHAVSTPTIIEGQEAQLYQ